MVKPIPILTEAEVYRLVNHFSRAGKNECWPWIGRKLKTTGRGVFRARGKSFSAPRVVYSSFVGPLTGDDCVLHRCDNPNCVNPSHLWAGSQIDNIADRDRKGRNRLAATHCVNGHEFTAGNTRFYGPDGRWRSCRACARENSRKYRLLTEEEARAY